MVNSFFGNISASNENNQKNSTSGTIYKNSNEIIENGTNLEYKLVMIGLQGVKRLRLAPEEKETRKQAKLAKKKTAKLKMVKKIG